MKCVAAILFFISLVLVSCEKNEKIEEVNPIDTYGEKIIGTWICDSIVEFKPDNNDSLLYYNTDAVPKTYVFKKVPGLNRYKWDEKIVEMDENAGTMYKDGPLGDIGDTWYILSIDEHKCILRLDYRGGLGSYITSQYWYYLRR